LLLRQGQYGAAEELYLKALGIAHEQDAKLWVSIGIEVGPLIGIQKGPL